MQDSLKSTAICSIIFKKRFVLGASSSLWLWYLKSPVLWRSSWARRMRILPGKVSGRQKNIKTVEKADMPAMSHNAAENEPQRCLCYGILLSAFPILQLLRGKKDSNKVLVTYKTAVPSSYIFYISIHPSSYSLTGVQWCLPDQRLGQRDHSEHTEPLHKGLHQVQRPLQWWFLLCKSAKCLPTHPKILE